jgi:acyl-CoA thioesterase I
MRRTSTLVLVVIALIAAGCGHSPTTPAPVTPPVDPTPAPPPPPPPPPKLSVSRILAFGDSMTYGSSSPPVSLRFTLTAGIPTSYPFRLEQMEGARYTAQTITVMNAGIGGETTASGRARFSGVFSEATPDLLILMEGANDLNQYSAGGLTDVSPIVASLEDMVREAGSRGAKVMVATLPPQRDGGSRAGAGPLLGKYNTQVKAMAAKNAITLVDVNAEFPLSMIGQDGLHPTDDGYAKLAQIFAAVINAHWEVTAPAVSTLTRAPAGQALAHTASPAQALELIAR